MTPDNEIVDLILLHEGGQYTNHPSDHGGPTRWGITIQVLSIYRGGRAVSALDIERLTRDEASDCYLSLFIRPFAQITQEPLRLNAIDLGVNAGVVRSVKILQQTIGVDVDGRIGPQTWQAAQMHEWNDLFTGLRLGFYESIIARDSSQLVWRNGWRRRALSFVFPEIRMVAKDLRHADEIYLPLYGHMGKAT